MKFSKAKVFVGLTCDVFLGFVIIFAIGRFILSSMMLSVRVSWADDQIEIIELSRRKAFEGDAHDAVRSLHTVVHYYPSGTKQPKGSKLDRIVET